MTLIIVWQRVWSSKIRAWQRIAYCDRLPYLTDIYTDNGTIISQWQILWNQPHLFPPCWHNTIVLFILAVYVTISQASCPLRVLRFYNCETSSTSLTPRARAQLVKMQGLQRQINTEWNHRRIKIILNPPEVNLVYVLQWLSLIRHSYYFPRKAAMKRKASSQDGSQPKGMLTCQGRNLFRVTFLVEFMEPWCPIFKFCHRAVSNI